MAKPVLAIDIDDVLFPFLPNMTQHHNAQFGTHLSIEDYTSYDFREIWGGPAEEITEKVEKFLEMDHRGIQPVGEAQAVLRQLKLQYQLVVVTSRDQLIKDSTLQWLKHHFPRTFADIIFAGNHATGRTHIPKVEVCKALGAKVLIDDNLSYVMEAAAGGIECLLFGDYPWNQAESLPPNVRRVAGWREVGEALP